MNSFKLGFISIALALVGAACGGQENVAVRVQALSADGARTDALPTDKIVPAVVAQMAIDELSAALDQCAVDGDLGLAIEMDGDLVLERRFSQASVQQCDVALQTFRQTLSAASEHESDDLSVDTSQSGLWCLCCIFNSCGNGNPNTGTYVSGVRG